MLHATAYGFVEHDATYASEGDRSNCAFSLVVEQRGSGGPLPDLAIRVRMRGRRAESLRRHLLAGKRLIVIGRLILEQGALGLLADQIELTGGTRT